MTERRESEEIQKLGVLHGDFILAALDKKTIQYKNVDGRWVEVVGNPTPDRVIRFIVCNPSLTFRVKPTPLVKWILLYRTTPVNNHVGQHEDEKAAIAARDASGGTLVRMEFDPETLEFLSSSPVER